MNVPVMGTYPAVEFQPSEAGSVYHTDQEVTDSLGSRLFRTYNAQFNGSNWHTIPSSTSGAAYATVQDPDGSIHYYYNGGAATWTTWLGSGNNTIYNAVDYGLIAGGSSNNIALGDLFTALSPGMTPGLPGGFVRIPQYNFPVVAVAPSGTIPMGISVPDQMIMQGLGTGGSGFPGTSNYHFSITDPSGAMTASALFFVDGTTHSTGGTEFRNLAFYWSSPASYAGDTVINAGWTATLIYRCTFENCPTAVNFAGYPSSNSPNALGSIMRECQVKYENGPNNATCVVLAGQQNGIMGPSILYCQGADNDGPAECTGVAIGGGPTSNEHNIIDGIHLTDWAICVDYADVNQAILNGKHSGCEYTTIANCEMDGYGWGVTSSNPRSQYWGACINLTTYDDTGEIYGQKIIGNTLSISHHSKYANPVVLIDTGALGTTGTAGPNSNVSSIDLIGNLIFSDITEGEAQPNTYGIQINAGDAIRVIGGKIGNMGTQAGSDGSANICISGNSLGSVLIDGVDLRPTFANAGGGATGSAASEYALLISGALTNTHGVVRVSNCDLSGYSANPVGVTGSVGSGSLFITNCTGYNQSSFNIYNGLASSAPTLPTSASRAAVLPGGHNFYGPSTIYLQVSSMGAVGLSINGIGLTFPADTAQVVSLSSPYDEIAFSGVSNLSQFVWVGA